MFNVNVVMNISWFIMCFALENYFNMSCTETIFSCVHACECECILVIEILTYYIPLLDSNRAAAFLQLVKLSKALADAETTIALKPQWEKVNIMYTQCYLYWRLISTLNSTFFCTSRDISGKDAF